MAWIFAELECMSGDKSLGSIWRSSKFELLLAQLHWPLQSDVVLNGPHCYWRVPSLVGGGVSLVWSGSNATLVLQVGGSDATSFSTGGRNASQCQQSLNICDLRTTEL